jgi:hypothetical protein
MVHNVYYRDVSGVSASRTEGLVFWFLFVKLGSPAQTFNRPRYTIADVEATLK